MTDLARAEPEAAAVAAWRPRYHVCGRSNWINDPNGPIHHAGRHHLFFQANARSPFWGPPSWGHVSSADLVTWTRHPDALTPAPGTADADGCWSGCTRIVDGRPAIYYTGVVGEDDRRVESVCRAWGSPDLLRWETDPANPLLAGPPTGRASGYHRDPFLWQDPAGWHLLLGSGTVTGERHGQILRYDSPDAITWTYGGVFFEAPRAVAGIDLGELWECPQLVFGGDDDRAVALVLSCQSPDASRPLMHSVAFVGTLAGGRFTGALQGPIDHGDVFYAPAVSRLADGRTLLWGWLQEHLCARRQGTLTHAGALSLPREARIDAGCLRITAAAEIRGLRRQPLAGVSNGAAAALRGRPQMELESVVAGVDGRAGWVLAAAGVDVVSVVLDTGRHALEVTVRDPTDGERFLRAALPSRGRHTLRVLVDGSALEILADDEHAVSTRAYPDAPWDVARLTATGAVRVEHAGGWALDDEAVR